MLENGSQTHSMPTSTLMLTLALGMNGPLIIWTYFNDMCEHNNRLSRNLFFIGIISD